MENGIELTDALRLIGRNVVAKQFIPKGQLVMKAATVQLDRRQYTALQQVGLERYCMDHPVDPDGGLLLLSEAALCLAADDSRLSASATNLGASGWIVEFRTARDVDADEPLVRQVKVDQWQVG